MTSVTGSQGQRFLTALTGVERYAEPGCSPRRRKPSPTLKVAGPQALTDEGQQANRTKPTPSNRETFLFRFKIKLCHSSKNFKTVRLFPLIRPGLCPVHLPRRGRRPPGGGRHPPGGERRPPGGGRHPPGGGRHPPGGGKHPPGGGKHPPGGGSILLGENQGCLKEVSVYQQLQRAVLELHHALGDVEP